MKNHDFVLDEIKENGNWDKEFFLLKFIIDPLKTNNSIKLLVESLMIL